MKIGVIGAGQVGGTLGRAWTGVGHEVTFGVRDTAAPKVQALLAACGGRATATGVPEAAASAEVVVVTTPWDATEAAVRAAGDLTGKVVLDCTNPLTPDLTGLAVGLTTSGAEQVAGWANGGRVAKAFNTTGADNMARPAIGGTPLTMFLAGDDAGAKSVAATLAAGIGFDPVDAGPLRVARLLEPLALLWITLAVRQGLGTGIALNLVRR